MSIIYGALSHKLITEIQDYDSKTCQMITAYKEPDLYFCLESKLGDKVYGHIGTGTLTIIHILRVREGFMMISFLLDWLHLYRIGDSLGKES